MSGSDRTLRKYMTGAALSATIICAGFAVSYGVVSWLTGSSTAFLSRGEGSGTGASATEVQRLIDEHDCWTRQAPADMEGRMPGHVVATVDGKTSYSSELVEPALESVFGTPVPGLTVHAFCR